MTWAWWQGSIPWWIKLVLGQHKIKRFTQAGMACLGSEPEQEEDRYWDRGECGQWFHIRRIKLETWKTRELHFVRERREETKRRLEQTPWSWMYSPVRSRGFHSVQWKDWVARPQQKRACFTHAVRLLSATVHWGTHVWSVAAEHCCPLRHSRVERGCWALLSTEALTRAVWLLSATVHWGTRTWSVAAEHYCPLRHSGIWEWWLTLGKEGKT